jgi:purine-binding chemotaxis protein CheW
MMPAALTNARRVAAEAEQKRIQLVTFRLEQYAFAVPVEQVWRVEALADFNITRVPGAVTFLEGLINLRGRIIPVIDLKKRLSLQPAAASDLPPAGAAAYPPKARLLIVEMEMAGQKDEKVAMIVDTVNDIRWFSAAGLHPPPAMMAGIDTRYLLGVLEEESRLWIVLELRQVLSTDERQSLRDEAEKSQEAGAAPPTSVEAQNIASLQLPEN